MYPVDESTMISDDQPRLPAVPFVGSEMSAGVEGLALARRMSPIPADRATVDA